MKKDSIDLLRQNFYPNFEANEVQKIVFIRTFIRENERKKIVFRHGMPPAKAQDRKNKAQFQNQYMPEPQRNPFGMEHKPATIFPIA